MIAEKERAEGPARTSDACESGVVASPFDPVQTRTLAAAVERILPSDAAGPGAKEARVVEFIQKRYSSGKVPSGNRRRFLSGLDLLESMASTTYGKPFHACRLEEQDAILARLQEIPHMTAYRFFRSLIGLTLAGFLSDPVHGGNQNHVGWRYIGWEPKKPVPVSSWGGSRCSRKMS